MATGPRLILTYKDFSKLTKVSHKGLGQSMIGVAKTLNAAGIKTEIWSTVGGDTLLAQLQADAKKNPKTPITHVVIAALFIPKDYLGRLCIEFPHIHFAVNCHSNSGFLQAEPEAITKAREALDLQQEMSNFHGAGNSTKYCDSMYGSYGVRPAYLPNLYFLSGDETNHRRVYSGGTLRIGIFGSNRVQKNMSSAIVAAITLGRELNTQTEIWMNIGRDDGNGNVVERAARAWTNTVPHVTLQALPWAEWPNFRRYVRTMHLCLQPSYSESFNLCTADALAEGCPIVVGEAIPWVPARWIANVDETKDIADTARQLLFDIHAPQQGLAALQSHNKKALAVWKAYLGVL